MLIKFIGGFVRVMSKNSNTVVINCSQGAEKSLKKDLIEKGKKYSKLCLKNAVKYKTNAKIHFIKSNEIDESKIDVNNFTKSDFKIYKGHGNHLDMFDRGFVEKNVKIIKNILKEG